jgi:hypothetical protein
MLNLVNCEHWCHGEYLGDVLLGGTEEVYQ